MKFNKETDYAIRMVLLCAKNMPKLLSTTEIVNICKIPPNLGKAILTKLTNNNILESIKGKNGGIRYVQSKNTISLYDIIKIFEKIEINSCIENKNSCLYKFGNCNVCEKLKDLKLLFEKELKNIYVESLIQK